ncbi:MAG: ABC transporter, partial [Bacteroidota bacterium]|nr:ABC transporter [Bacteroidota bacterium]
TSLMVEKLLFDLNKEAGTTLVVVTHDLDLAAKTQKVIKLKGGKIISGHQEEFMGSIKII